MGHTIEYTLNHIHNADATALAFIEEWCNNLPYITAYTSGSTGKPKEIHLLKIDMIESAKATCKYFNITNKSTLVLPLSASYIAGKMMIVRAIVSGATLWIEKASNKPISNEYTNIDLIAIVPSQVDWLIQNNYACKIKNLLIGGGQLSQIRSDALINLGYNAYASYGMTETCSHIALRHISSQIYKTLPNITISKDSRNCAIINAPKFSFKHITTNDIVEIIDDNTFKWIGRFDNIINTGGIKVSPEEIEQKIAQFISEPFYVIGEQDEKWGEVIVLYIETNKSFNQDLLQNKLKQVLHKYFVPKKIKCVASFHRTESGKIKRINF